VEVIQTAMAFGVEGKEKERGQGGDRGGRPQGINGQGGLDGNSGNATRGSFTTGAGKVISETISQMVIAAGMANLPEDGTGRTREDTDTREHVSMSF
jgi:hypothetical protein